MPQKSILFNRNINCVFKNVLIMDLKHLTRLTTEESSTESAVICHKGSKM
jgi:hypothetical protein